jgi:tripartite ATP-independent transporter DctP family solute receptor
MPVSNRRTLLKSIAAAGLFAPALVRPALARTTTLTVASLLGEDKPETKIWRRIAELVEAQMPGRFRFNVVTSGALGGEKEVAEAARLGAVQASLATASSLSGWVPELQILDLPFLYRDADHVKRVVDGAVGADLAGRLGRQDFIAAAFIDYGARHLLAKVPMLHPDALAGVKIRVIQSPLHTKLWSRFGAVPVGIPITETYNALSTGVADAMDLTKSAYAGFKLYEVVPVMMLTGHIRASGVVYFAASFWNTLSPEEQGVLSAAARDGAATFDALIVADEAKSIETALAHGGKVLDIPDMAEWRKGAEGVWQDFAPVVGGEAQIAAVEGA